MIQRIHHLGIKVRDFDKMIEFYKQAFGFEIVGQELDLSFQLPKDKAQLRPRVLMMRTGNCFIEIIQNLSLPVFPAMSPSAQGSIAHFSVEVTDIDQEFDRLKALGMSFETPGPEHYGHVKSVHGRDPEGNDIELLEIVGPWDCDLNALLQ